MTTSMLTLTCYVRGDDYRFVFKVRIGQDKDVDDLKNLIKDQNSQTFHELDARFLVLWKPEVTVPLDGNVKENVEKLNIDDEKSLKPFDSLSDIFPTPLAEEIHIIVDAPPPYSELVRRTPTNEERAHKEAVEMAKAAPAPRLVSKHVDLLMYEQANRPIYNGRPANRRGPSVTIYHEAFARLKDALRDPTKIVDADENRTKHTARLSLAAREIYDTERERSEAVLPYLGEVLGIDLECDAIAAEPTDDKSYGYVEGVTCYVELKNEFGDEGDGAIQAALTLRKHLAEEKYEKIRNASCCPCIIVVFSGPYIMFLGAIFADVFSVEPLTDYIYLGRSPFPDGQIPYLSRIFAAVSDALNSLKQFYRHLKLRSTPHSPRLFPNPTYLDGCKPGAELIFTGRLGYDGRVPGPDDYGRSLFRATYDNKSAFVKFCEQYNSDAHRLLANSKYAPELFFCAQVQGGLTMVVMEFIDGRDAYCLFQNFPMPEEIMANVISAMQILKGQKIVFGGLRRSNIMITKSGGSERALLTHFEWAGVHGQARYPPCINDPRDELRYVGVIPLGLMKTEHDEEIIENVRKGYGAG